MKTSLFLLLLVGTFLINPPQNANADILDHWTTTQLTTNAYYMTGIACGGGHWVATAQYMDGVEYFLSTNGLEWTEDDYNTGGWGSTLKYENGHFISVGGYGTVSYSTNGVDWSEYYVPNAYIGDGRGFGDISYGNGLFVSVGMTNYEVGNPPTVITTGYILSSPDGTNWTSRLPPLLTKGYISSITYGSSNFVAVGDGDGFLYFSANGTTWTRNVIPTGGSVVSYANSLFIIPIGAGTNVVGIPTSLFGNGVINTLSTTLVPTGLTNQLGRIVYSHGLYMSLAGSYLATSSDGTNWFQYPSASGSSPFATDGDRIATVSSVYTGLGVAPGYDGFVNLSDPLVDVRLTNGSPRNVVLSGLVGRNYQILSSDVLGSSASWSTNFSVQLTNPPFSWTDSTATNKARFYRGALLP